MSRGKQADQLNFDRCTLAIFLSESRKWVSCSLKSSQPQRIISGLRELKGPVRQKLDRKNRVRKLWRIYGMKCSWKGHKDRNRHKHRIKGVGKLGWFMSKSAIKAFVLVSARGTPVGKEPRMSQDMEYQRTCFDRHSSVSKSLYPCVVVVAFSSLPRILGECSTIHSPFAFFLSFQVEISSRALNPLFRPRSVHNGSAS